MIYFIRCHLSAIRHGLGWAWVEHSECLTGDSEGFISDFHYARATRLYHLETGLDVL
jgi:hypothetical protein